MAASPINAPENSLSDAMAELDRRHRLGESDVCESVLAGFPELCAERDAVLEQVYFEFVLCQESNRPISPESLLRRFPEYQTDLVSPLEFLFREHGASECLDRATRRIAAIW